MSTIVSNPLSLNFGETIPETKPLLLLIDGHSLAFRAYYAFSKAKKGPLRTSTGIPTSVCFGFLNSLIQAIKTEKPQYLAIAFDTKEPTFRHQADANYKADRQETPEDFIPDFENLRELLSAFRLQIVTAVGYEADDLLGTLAQQGSVLGYQVKIVSGDKDLFQLVDDRNDISVIYLDHKAIKSSTTSMTEFKAAKVVEKMGVKPEQIVDYKALCGDKSDNIPGVLGIGDKTSVKLLQEYGDLETIYQNIEQIKGAIQQKLKTDKAKAEHSQYLAKIVLDVALEVKLEDCQLQGFDASKVKPILKKLELNKILKTLDDLQSQLGGTIQQLSLFESNKSEKEAQIKPEIIDTQAKLSYLIDVLKTCTDIRQPVAWDTESTSLDAREAKLVGIGCCWGNRLDQIAYIPLNHSQGKQLRETEVLSRLKTILETKKYPKSFQNTKFDRTLLKHHGIKLEGVVFDTMIASYILHPEATHNLTDLSERYLSGITAKSYQDLAIAKEQTIADLEINKVAEYCGLDAYVTFLLTEKLQVELSQIPELYQLFSEVELPLEPILTEMEDRGIKIDTTYLQKLSQQLEEKLAIIEKQAYQDAGEEFNLGSPKQLSEILFDKLGLNRKKSRKTKTGYSTDHATLEKLQGDHPVIDQILEYRTLAKLKSTYVDALPTLVNPQSQRVHTNFNQTITTTGRLSSSNPNLQNIPIRTEFSRQIRQAFIPEKNWFLVSADYSQIELRILAHLSQEEVLLEAYKQQEDVHSVTAKLLLEKEEISAEERRLGKIINFGVIYGMGAQRFSREAGMSAEIGKEFIEKYRRKYAKVFTYLEGVKKEAVAKGFVTTICGRRRYFDFSSESLRQLRGCQAKDLNLEEIKYSYADAQLLRGAANAPIQGSSADIIKIAMVRLDEVLREFQARLLLQVHDELVIEVPQAELAVLPGKIKSVMEEAVKLSVPLVVDIHIGNNWMEAK